MNRTNVTNFPDELNLARYIELVRRQWRVIVVCAILGAGAAFLYGALQPKQYTARADVAVVRTGTIVVFDPKIRTVSDTDPNAQGLESVTRRASLLAIGSSPDLALKVIEQIGTQLPETLREPTLLLKQVALESNGDLFTIRATAETPELAALIANQWAAVYEARVNALFSERPGSVELIREQAAQAKTTYDTQQRAVVAYMEKNPIETLKRQQALLARQLDAQVNIQGKLTQLAADLQALGTRMQTNGTTVSTADQLTQILIEVSAFNNSGEASSAVRWDVSATGATGMTPAEQLAQLDALAKAIEQRRTAVTADQVQALYTQLNTVQAQLETAQQQLKELQASRDLAFSTFQTLNTKVAEVGVSMGAENQLVQIAVTAIPPSLPVTGRGLLNALIGGVLGLVIGFLLGLLLEFQRARTQVLKPAPQ